MRLRADIGRTLADITLVAGRPPRNTDMTGENIVASATVSTSERGGATAVVYTRF